MSLAEIEAMITALPVADQARLLEFLAPRVTDATASASAQPTQNGNAPSGNGSPPDAWREFRTVGDRLARTAAQQLGSASLTQSITDARR